MANTVVHEWMGDKTPDLTKTPQTEKREVKTKKKYRKNIQFDLNEMENDLPFSKNNLEVKRVDTTKDGDIGEEAVRWLFEDSGYYELGRYQVFNYNDKRSNMPFDDLQVKDLTTGQRFDISVKSTSTGSRTHWHIDHGNWSEYTDFLIGYIKKERRFFILPNKYVNREYSYTPVPKISYDTEENKEKYMYYEPELEIEE